MINALILLNCDESGRNDRRTMGEVIAEVLRISARKVDRVKRRFVEEGLEAALGGRQGRRPRYLRKADGEFEARLVALSCGQPPAGRPAREDYEYRRLGTCNVFMATEPKAGRRMTRVTERRTKADWARFLGDIAERYPDASRITLVMDNLSTHRPGALCETFDPVRAKALWDRFDFVHTPKHGSWLNVAEVEPDVMIRQCLNRRTDSIGTVRGEVAAWQAARDRVKAKVNWQFTTDDARIGLKRLYPTLDEWLDTRSLRRGNSRLQIRSRPRPRPLDFVEYPPIFASIDRPGARR